MDSLLLIKNMSLIFATLCLAFGTQRVWAEEDGSTMTGAALYHVHCASCHGESGRGDGMVGAALRTPPADLTLLTHKNNEEHLLGVRGGILSLVYYLQAIQEK